jgi:hypothetical protein
MLAYRVPFRLERDHRANTYTLINTSTETVSGVTFTLHGRGLLAASAAETVPPGHGVEVTIAGYDLARSTILVVRWFRPNGVEYLWRVSF